MFNKIVSMFTKRNQPLDSELISLLNDVISLDKEIGEGLKECFQKLNEKDRIEYKKLLFYQINIEENIPNKKLILKDLYNEMLRLQLIRDKIQK